VACLDGLAAVATLRATATFAPLLPLVRELFDTLLEQTRQRLGDAAWAAAWESGEAMTMDEAIIYGEAHSSRICRMRARFLR
jgi:hypothetical protein